MCKLASFVLTRDAVYWSRFSNSHTEIIREHGLCEDVAYQPVLLRAEIAPIDYDYSRATAEWDYQVDQRVLPPWACRRYDEARVRAALKDWRKYHCRQVKTNEDVSLGDKCSIESGNNVCIRACAQASVRAGDDVTVHVTHEAKVQVGDRATVRGGVYGTVQAGKSAILQFDCFAGVHVGNDALIQVGRQSNIHAADNAVIRADRSVSIVAGQNANIIAVSDIRITAGKYAMIHVEGVAAIDTGEFSIVSAMPRSQVKAGVGTLLLDELSGKTRIIDALSANTWLQLGMNGQWYPCAADFYVPNYAAKAGSRPQIL
jgi:hypothetical protein